jgi:uncharacterized membrane protein YeaQ/YmgE (transglycosylase-associated protein family)
VTTLLPSANRAPDNLSRFGVENRMYLSLQVLSVILLVGLVAAWVVAKVVTKHGMGIAGDALIGVIGAFIGPWLLPRLGVHLGTGYVFAILSAAAGRLALACSVDPERLN